MNTNLFLLEKSNKTKNINVLQISNLTIITNRNITSARGCLLQTEVYTGRTK